MHFENYMKNSKIESTDPNILFNGLEILELIFDENCTDALILQIYFKDKYFSTTVGLILSPIKENRMISPCKTAQNPRKFRAARAFFSAGVLIFPKFWQMLAPGF